MTGFINALKLVAASWITLAVMASGVSGMVLCFGADGHFALEMSHQGRCQGDAETSDQRGPAADAMLASATTDYVGSCVDVSLVSDTMSQTVSAVRYSLVSTDDVADGLSAYSPDARLGFDVRLNAPRVLRCAPLRTSPSLLAKRTIVLRV